MKNLVLKMNNFINNYLKDIKELNNVIFKVQENEEIDGIELIYALIDNDTACNREKVYDILNDILYNDFEKKGFTEEEIDSVSIIYDYFEKIEIKSSIYSEIEFECQSLMFLSNEKLNLTQQNFCKLNNIFKNLGNQLVFSYIESFEKEINRWVA